MYSMQSSRLYVNGVSRITVIEKRWFVSRWELKLSQFKIWYMYYIWNTCYIFVGPYVCRCLLLAYIKTQVPGSLVNPNYLTFVYIHSWTYKHLPSFLRTRQSIWCWCSIFKGNLKVTQLFRPNKIPKWHVSIKTSLFIFCDHFRPIYRLALLIPGTYQRTQIAGANITGPRSITVKYSVKDSCPARSC